MKILILENPTLGRYDNALSLEEVPLATLESADIVIAIPEGGEPVCLKHPGSSRASIVQLKLPTEAEKNAQRAREHLEARVKPEVAGEDPMVKAARVWGDDAPA